MCEKKMYENITKIKSMKYQYTIYCIFFLSYSYSISKHIINLQYKASLIFLNKNKLKYRKKRNIIKTNLI